MKRRPTTRDITEHEAVRDGLLHAQPAHQFMTIDQVRTRGLLVHQRNRIQ